MGQGKVISVGGEGEYCAAVTASGCLILSFHRCFLCVLYNSDQGSLAGEPLQVFLLLHWYCGTPSECDIHRHPRGCPMRF